MEKIFPKRGYPLTISYVSKGIPESQNTAYSETQTNFLDDQTLYKIFKIVVKVLLMAF